MSDRKAARNVISECIHFTVRLPHWKLLWTKKRFPFHKKYVFLQYHKAPSFLQKVKAFFSTQKWSLDVLEKRCYHMILEVFSPQRSRNIWEFWGSRALLLFICVIEGWRVLFKYTHEMHYMTTVRLMLIQKP